VANELQTDYLSGKNVYFLLRNSVGQIWNGAAFEAYATANYANYDIAATEQGTASGYYTASMPSVSLGIYYVVAKERAGGAPAETDITVGTGTINWDGSAVVTANALADAILKRDVDNVEASAAIHSLCSAILKMVSKFDVSVAGNAVTYRTDGTTAHMTQSKTTNSSLTPIQSLGVGA
jgi:hypothetical protein